MQWNEFSRHIRHLPTRDLKKIEQAFELGKRAHGDQKRKSGEPYFTHPIAVAIMLADMGADAETIIATLLHDTVEDTLLTLDEIDHEFGRSVTTLIDGVTKLTGREVKFGPNLNEQTESLRKMFTLMQKDVRIMIIKLVDRLHNMQTIEFLPHERQVALAEETRDVYVKIADRLCMQDLRDDLMERCIAVLDPKGLVKLLEIRASNEQRAEEITAAIKRYIREHEPQLAARTSFHLEQKTWSQLLQQRDAGSAPVTGQSFLSVAFVCETIDSCYRILGALHQKWKRELLSFQDFINVPQMNGYQGLHTTIILEDGTRVRCKIRTKEMHEYARTGIATKCFDSEAFGLAEYLPWTQQISPLTTDTQGSSDNFWAALQNDILGENIIIHGPDDAALQLPKGATALDAAFYFLHEEALKLKTVLVNGKEVPLGTQLINAASLNFELASRQTCTLEWLRSVQTTIAAASIRAALARQSDNRKLSAGKSLFQSMLTEKKRGFIEELDESRLHQQISALGFASLQEVYIALADGRLQPIEVYRVLFRESQRTPRADHPPMTIEFRSDPTHHEALLQSLLRSDAYPESIEQMNVHRRKDRLSVRVRGHIDSQHAEELSRNLQSLGARRVRVRRRKTLFHMLIIFLLVLCWGLDPVLSKMMLNNGVPVALFAFARAWSLFLLSIVVLWSVRRQQKAFARIPMHYPSLWIAGIALFFISILTYLYLSFGSPLLYNTMLRINAVLLLVPFIVYPRAIRSVLLVITLSIAGISILLAGPFGRNEVMLAFSILAAFSIFTFATGRFQSVARVQARFAQLFASTNLIAALSALVLPFTGMLHMPENLLQIPLIVGYSVIFIGVPYLIFHVMTENLGYATISPWINATIPVTLVAQIFLLQDFAGISSLIPGATLLIAASLVATTSIRRFSSDRSMTLSSRSTNGLKRALPGGKKE